MKLLFIVSLVQVLVIRMSIQHVHYVRPDEYTIRDCPVQTPCPHSLEEFVQQPDKYFISGSSFMFLAGNHTLFHSLELQNIVNVTLRGKSDINTRRCSEGAVFDNVTNLTIEGLTFSCYCNDQYKNVSVLRITNSKDIFVLQSNFLGNVDGHNSMCAMYSANSTIIIMNSLFERNAGIIGGAIYASDESNLTLIDSTFMRNRALQNGGAIAALGSLLVLIGNSSNEFSGNVALGEGGVIYCYNCSILIAGNNNFDNNSAMKHGGVLSVHHGNVTIASSNTHFSCNQADLNGGAIFTSESSLSFNGTAILFRGNSAINGGAVYCNSGSILSRRIALLSFTQNRARALGGAIFGDTDALITVEKGYKNTKLNAQYFANNMADGGGGAISCGYGSRIHLSGLNEFVNNSAKNGSGAIEVQNTIFYITGKALFINNTGLTGGALYSLLSTIYLWGIEVAFRGNSAMTVGGAICFEETVLETKYHLDLMGNSAQETGGAIYSKNVYVSSKFVIISGNIANNRAKECGAIYIANTLNVTFENVNVTGNAQGALCIFDSRVYFTGKTTVIKSNINTGRLGGGIYSLSSTLSFTSFTRFENNTASDGGAVYLLYGQVCFNTRTLFTSNMADNYGGALYALGTAMTFDCTTNFSSNYGRRGGAIYLRSPASIKLYSTFTTSYNFASEYGGAIFNEDTITPIQCEAVITKAVIDELPLCFLQLLEINYASGSIYFPYDEYSQSIFIISHNDLAGKEGNFLYGGLLDRCQLLSKDVTQAPVKIVPYILLTENVIHINSEENNISSGIGSKSYQLCFCENSTVYECSGMINVELFRGQTWRVSLLALNQLQALTSTLVVAVTSRNTRLKLNQNSQTLPQQCFNLTYNLFSAEKSVNEELNLYADGPCRDTGLAKVTIHVTFKPCPNGFSLSGERCICEKRLQSYGANCSIDEVISITKIAGSKFWVGALYNKEKSYEGIILYKACPDKYCSVNTVTFSLEDLDRQCNFHRKGVLCGACIANYSLSLGASKCMKCSNTYLALIVPFAVAGIALVTFLSFLQLTVATGMMNSVILYANIVQVNRNVFFPLDTVNILSVFIAWLNLDLGFDTCFYDGMDAYAQIWLQFAFPVYVWTLISLIIISSRYSITVSKLIGHNPVAVLATLILMSYTKTLKIIVDVYSSVDLDYPDNKIVRVWLKDANVPYLQSGHLVLTVVTTLVLVFLFLPYTVLLLLGHKLHHFSGRKNMRWLNKLKPLLDSYYAPYKIQTRYWTGLLLLVRCALYIIFSYNSVGGTNSSLLAITVAFTATTMFPWFSVTTYKKRSVNILEAFMYLNLVTLSAYTLAKFNSPVPAYTLVGIVFAITMGIVTYHFYLTCFSRSATVSKIRKIVILKVEKFKSPKATVTDELARAGASSHDPHKIITKTVIELREPLLDLAD